MIGKLLVQEKKIVDMKISEVINKLQEIQKEHGDLQVRLFIGENDVDFGCLDFSVEGPILYLE